MSTEPDWPGQLFGDPRYFCEVRGADCVVYEHGHPVGFRVLLRPDIEMMIPLVAIGAPRV